MKGFIVGVILIVSGTAVIYFHNQLHKMFGDIEWAENTFGDSRAIYPLVGAGLIVMGVLFMFGLGASNPTEISGGFAEGA